MKSNWMFVVMVGFSNSDKLAESKRENTSLITFCIMDIHFEEGIMDNH
jgi:hypothetical protein